MSPPPPARGIGADDRATQVAAYLSDAMSITKRYFTSLFSMRS